MSFLPIAGTPLWLVAITVLLTLWSGCSPLQPLQQRSIDNLGHFEFGTTAANLEGIVVGVPRGKAEPAAVDYANSIRDRIGAGIVIAYDFAANRIPVEQPLAPTGLIGWPALAPDGPGKVYPEYKKQLTAAARGPVHFYVGLRVADQASPPGRIEIASAGFSFEQLKALKQAYQVIRDRMAGDDAIPRLEMALDPLDAISWQPFGVKNHGVLMIAEKGLIIRVPRTLTAARLKSRYREIIATWSAAAWTIAQGHGARFPERTVQRLSFGRIESVAARSHLRGVVLSAPHGSFDWYTGELVEEMSLRTALAAIVTRGFTPTECAGWRINVNRPTERRYPTETVERKTARATEIFQAYRDSVLEAAGGPLELYIEMHQNGSEQNIEVASFGLGHKEARALKHAYEEIRDRVLGGAADVAKVNLLIEPVDAVAIGAWAAKDEGVLRLARTSLHFELPARRVLNSERARRAYTVILTELIKRVAAWHDDRSETQPISFPPPNPNR